MPISIRLPAIAADFEAGTLASWHKSVGETVEIGEVIVDVETDKAMVEVEATESGTLGQILVPAGSSDVAVNTVIGILLKDGETADDIAAAAAAAGNDAEAPQQPVVDVPASALNVEIDTAHKPQSRVFASPLARRIALQNDIDLTKIRGRGPNQRVLRADVEAALSSANAHLPQPAQAPTDFPQQTYTEIPNNNIRKVVARRLTEAKQQVPHFYLTVDCRLDLLLDIRQQVNDQYKKLGGEVKVSVNDFIVKAAAAALVDVPAANASWSEEAIRRYDNVDIAVAVATPNGLITPVVRQSDKKSLSDLSLEIRELAMRANAGRLQPDEYKGGGFTISNLGMYGVKEFSAIINPPQSCILAVGAGEKRPVVNGDTLGIATLMSCTLSVDHRSVDGAVGAEFLQAFKHYIENPAVLLLG